MTAFDYGFLAVLAVSIAWGVWRGLVRELLSLAGWVIAFLCATLFAGPLSESITPVMRPENSSPRSVSVRKSSRPMPWWRSPTSSVTN